MRPLPIHWKFSKMIQLEFCVLMKVLVNIKVARRIYSFIAIGERFPFEYDERHAGILAALLAGIVCERDNAHQMSTMAEKGFEPIDLVVTDLLPWDAAAIAATGIANLNVADTFRSDIIRTASIHSKCVTVVTTPMQYGVLRAEMSERNMSVSKRTRIAFAAAALTTTAAYDNALVSAFLAASSPGAASTIVQRFYSRNCTLPRGIGPYHMSSTLYQHLSCSSPFKIILGLPTYEMMINAAHGWSLVKSLRKAVPQWAIVVNMKNSSPSGAALGSYDLFNSPMASGFGKTL